MVDPKLVNYIKTTLSKGFSLQQIKKQLLKVGWPERDINAAINFSTKKRLLPPIPPPARPIAPILSTYRKPIQKSSKKLWIIFILVIVVISGILAFYIVKQRLSVGTRISPVPIPNIINCNTNIDCFIEASKNCDPAKVIYTTIIDLFGVEQITTSFFEIKELEANKCVFYLRTESNDIKFSNELIQQMLANNFTLAEIENQEQESNQIADELEGKDGTCRFNTPDLTSMLNRWEAGTFSTEDWDVAECEGDYFSQET